MDESNERYLEFCGPFIEAIKDVYSTMMGVSLSASSPVIKSGKESHGEFSAIMGINGHYQGKNKKKLFKGTLVLSWPREVYLKSASAMLMEEYKDYSDEIADVGMEIANITMGNAKKVLVERGYSIDMSIPTSIRGPHHEIKSQEGVVTISTLLNSSLGIFYIELNYEDYRI